MDNRRPTGTSPDKTFNRGGYQRKTEGGYGAKNFQSGNDRFQNRNDNSQNNRFQNRDDNSQPRRDNRFGSAPAGRDERPPQRTGGYQPRDNRFQPRDDRYSKPRGEGFQSRDNRPPSRENSNDNRGPRSDTRPRFENRGDRPDNRGGRFDNRGERSDNRGGRFTPNRNLPGRGKPYASWKNVERPRIYDEMQLTDGKHIGKFMKSTASPSVRPTARRVREAMFKLIFRKVRAGRFLDLCAGSGMVGMEAISRGSLNCTFVERSAKMCGFIKKNLEFCGIKEGHGNIVNIEAVPYLKQMEKRRRYWDVVFYDPPYDTNYEEVLSYLSRGVAIKPGGTLVIEHHSEMFFPENLGVLKRWKVVPLGDTTLSFYDRK